MKRLLIIAIGLLNTACSFTSPPVALHDFGLPPHATQVSKNPTSTHKPELSVDSPAWLSKECIHYRLLYSTPTQLDCYNADKWIAPPAELFKQLLLTNSQLASHHVIIQLLNFEQQFDSANQARVVLNFVADAYALDSEQLLSTRQFHLEQATTSADASGAVTGFTQLMQQANTQLQQWLQGIK